MTKSPEAFAELEDLLDLGTGIDMRTTLLRVLTHLYLQRPTHTPEDEHYYTELALRLIDAADISERAALAARLAPYPSAPRPVIDRLARDVIEVAAPILKDSPSSPSAPPLPPPRRCRPPRPPPRQRLASSPSCSTRRPRLSAG
jgi:hypothetical protein